MTILPNVLDVLFLVLLEYMRIYSTNLFILHETWCANDV